MKYLIVLILSLALQSCQKVEDVVTVKNVDFNNTFTISGKTRVKVNGENLEILFVKFDDYGTTGDQPPYTVAYLEASAGSGTRDLSIFHYLRTEKMNLVKLDSISANESSPAIGFFHERGDIDGKYAIYFKAAFLGSAFKRDNSVYLKVDSARFIITKMK